MYLNNAKRSRYFVAALWKHCFSIFLALLSLVWLVVYGANFLFPQTLDDPDPAAWLIAIWPYVPVLKMIPIFIGYLTIAHNVAYDVRVLQLRTQVFEIKRKRKQDHV